MNLMPAEPRPAAMSPAELKQLMEAHALTNLALADLLEMHRNTVSRWLKGETPIGAANALLIREAIKKHKK